MKFPMTGIVLLGTICTLIAGAAPAQETRQATGVKVGEVSSDSAIVWMRVTESATRNNTGFQRPGRPAGPLPEGVEVKDLHGACPGAEGKVRLRYGTDSDLAAATTTEWIDVKKKNDFSHQFRLTGLAAATVYYFSAETADSEGSPHEPLRGQFETAPPADDYADVTFTVITGQAYKDLDHEEGFHMYPAMGRLKPKFIVPTGDTVYYDSEDPRATTVALARHHWHRMYSLPRHVAFHLAVPGYWEKDDHDCHANDCWPTQRPEFMLPFTFTQGLEVYREQAPLGQKPFRTARWGKGLQVWLVEGRDYRSPNPMPDGPDKTIWGAEQKRWLKRTMLQSDADWNVLVSPTPIVGPDRENKRDNHSNAAFAHEGDEIRSFFQENFPENGFVCCGDRHWQYHSVHPETGVQEFSSGPASDQHAGGAPDDPQGMRKFFRQKGGFLSVQTNVADGKSRITFRLHDVHGKVVYEFAREKPRS